MEEFKQIHPKQLISDLIPIPVWKMNHHCTSLMCNNLLYAFTTFSLEHSIILLLPISNILNSQQIITKLKIIHMTVLRDFLSRFGNSPTIQIHFLPVLIAATPVVILPAVESSTVSPSLV